MSLVIRDGLESDIRACLDLNAGYETEFVWQMTIREDGANRTMEFRRERLPRVMEVEQTLAETRLKAVLPKEHCFLVAVADEADILGLLTMRHDPIHSIGFIYDLVVTESARRHGIGSRLLRVARRWARERQIKRLMIEKQTKNYPAITFCQNAGFVFCGYNDQYFQDNEIAVFFGQALR